MALVAGSSMDEVNSMPKWRNKNSLKLLVQDTMGSGFDQPNVYDPVVMFTPTTPVNELNEAATKVQKVYRSYRTRRNLADCAVVVEELWWKALDFATLNRSSVSFFDDKKPETAVSRWARARTKAAKVGKGLSKDEKAQKLALQHWLEAIDPRHRYGHNLHLYYDVWSPTESSQPFFYWLDVGGGKEVNLDRCSRSKLHRQCIKYLGPKERVSFAVDIEDGKLVFRESGKLVDTTGNSKWIFVLSTTRTMYVGQKQKGLFQHSSFLAGGAITAAGRLIARDGILQAVWPYSGHYHPTTDNFNEFLTFLHDHNIDVSNVKTCGADDDCPAREHSDELSFYPSECDTKEDKQLTHELSKRMSHKWSTGVGARIGCVREYPAPLQNQAFEHMNLSGKASNGVPGNYGTIRSPRPSPKLRLSPSVRYMGLPSPRIPNPRPT